MLPGKEGSSWERKEGRMLPGKEGGKGGMLLGKEGEGGMLPGKEGGEGEGCSWGRNGGNEGWWLRRSNTASCNHHKATKQAKIPSANPIS